MSASKAHIAVCICTYKRPELLAAFFKGLVRQRTDDRFFYSVVVVDNDHGRSGHAVVERARQDTGLPILYVVEPVQNISGARNRAIACAKGEYVAVIDDDEVPADDWLFRLFEAITSYRTDGVLGPVVPRYQVAPPAWVIKARLCERERFPTGTRLRDVRYTRTSNALLSATLFASGTPPFDLRFGLTGGEDSDFFRRMLTSGKTFVWCDEACVYETVPAERLEAGYFLRRALLRGIANAQGVSIFSRSWTKSMAAVVCYSIALPILLLSGYHRFFKGLISLCDHLGKVLAIAGVQVLQRRTF
jgi:glycosyltransferase involved in cell wall biosynthesis